MPMIGFVVIFAGIVLIAQNCGSSNVGQPDQEIVPEPKSEFLKSGVCPDCGKGGSHSRVDIAVNDGQKVRDVWHWRCNECDFHWPVD